MILLFFLLRGGCFSGLAVDTRVCLLPAVIIFKKRWSFLISVTAVLPHFVKAD